MHLSHQATTTNYGILFTPAGVVIRAMRNEVVVRTCESLTRTEVALGREEAAATAV